MPIDPSLVEEIRSLEQACLDLDVRADPERLAPMLADDFLEFGSSGRVWTKATVLELLPEESGLSFSLSEFAADELGPNVVHATYRIATRDGESTRHSLRSSIWVRRSGRWQMLFHQGTPCDPA